MSKTNYTIYIFLGIIVIALVGYMYVYQPLQEDIAVLKDNIAVQESQLAEMDAKIATETRIDTDIAVKEDEIQKLADRMFVDITQEEALVLSNKLVPNPELIIDTVGFSESPTQDESGNIIVQQVSFSANYMELMDYLRNIRKYKKNIAVTDLNLSRVEFTPEELVERLKKAEEEKKAEEAAAASDESSEDENEEEAGEETDTTSVATRNQNDLIDDDTKLTVNITLEYRTVPSIAGQPGVAGQEQYIAHIAAKRDVAKGLFYEYEGFISEEELKKREEEALRAEQEQLAAQMPSMPYMSSGMQPQEPEKPRKLIYGFEDTSSFFVGSDLEVRGAVLRSKKAVSGKFSADLTFDFTSPKEANAANLVFGNKGIMIGKQPEAMYIQIYAYENSDHEIGFAILDSAGKEHMVTITAGVGWTEWEELSVDLPATISYPAVIQRIYIKADGYDQKIKGRYLFDQLQTQ